MAHDLLVRYQYRISLRDFMAAHLLHLARHPRRVVWPALFVIPVVTVILELIELPVFQANTISLALLLALQLILLVALICLVYALWWKRLYDLEAHQWEREDITIELADEFVRWATSDGHSELRWSAFREVVENDRLFLLYVGRRRFWSIPKRHLGPEGTQRLRTLASQTHPEGASDGQTVETE